MADRQQFVYQFLPGDRPRLATDRSSWTASDIAIGEAHYRRLREATEEGIVILAGLSLDGRGPAVVIFEDEDEEEAGRFMQEDPFVQHGLFRASLHPFPGLPSATCRRTRRTGVERGSSLQNPA